MANPDESRDSETLGGAGTPPHHLTIYCSRSIDMSEVKAKSRSVSMTNDDYKKVKVLAAKHDKSFSDYVMSALKLYADMDNVMLEGSPANGGTRAEAVAYQRGAAWMRRMRDENMDVDVFPSALTPDVDEGYRDWLNSQTEYQHSESMIAAFNRGAYSVWSSSDD